MRSGIDICICTFNRVEFLKINLKALLPQLASGKASITVVDNNSTDGTKAFMQTITHEHSFVRYAVEQQQGLSHARNRGWNESPSDWIFYIDDDCVPPPGLIQEAILLIEKYKDLDALGGPIDPLFIDPPPEWLPTGLGSFSIPAENIIFLEQGYLRGGCFLIKRTVLSSLGGFNPLLGMRGEKLQYGEELEFQYRMRQSGYKIGYAPSLKIKHFVRTDKISPRWLIQSEYAKRRDKMVFEPVSLQLATLHLLRTILSRSFRIPYYFFNMVLNKKYTSQHFILDSLLPLAYRTGEWIGAFKHIFL